MILKQLSCAFLRIARKYFTMSIFLQIPNEEYRTNISSRSNSFSFYDEERIRKPRRAISLEEVCLYSSRKEVNKSKRRRRSTQVTSRRASRRHSSRKLQRNEIQLNSFYNRSFSRHSSQNESGRHSRTSSRSSRTLMNESPRINSRHTSNTSYLDKLYAEEVLRKDRRRRKIVTIIIVSFCVLLLTSICSVVITLTHQSTAVIEKDNTTVNLTYYTFASAPEVLCKPGTRSW